MDHVEQSDRLGRLVRLEPADAVQPDAGMAGEQRRPLGERLLDPAFAEIALSRGDQVGDLLGGTRLADGDKLDVRWLASSELRSRGDAVDDMLAAGRGAAHAARLIGTDR